MVVHEDSKSSLKSFFRMVNLLFNAFACSPTPVREAHCARITSTAPPAGDVRVRVPGAQVPPLRQVDWVGHLHHAGSQQSGASGLSIYLLLADKVSYNLM